MFHRKLIDYMPDCWMFDYRMVENPDAIVPLDNNGFAKTRTEWLAIRDSVDLFFAVVTDQDIEEFNDARDAEHREYHRRLDESRKQQGRKPPKPGYIYLLRSSTGEYKVGKSVDPSNRKKLIGIQMPQQVTLLYTAKMLNMGKAEELLHAALSEWHVNGEWFNPPPNIIQWIVSGQWLDTCGLTNECEGEERHE